MVLSKHIKIDDRAELCTIVNVLSSCKDAAFMLSTTTLKDGHEYYWLHIWCEGSNIEQLPVELVQALDI